MPFSGRSRDLGHGFHPESSDWVTLFSPKVAVVDRDRYWGCTDSDRPREGSIKDSCEGKPAKKIVKPGI